MIDVKIFSRKGVEKDERAQEIEAAEVARLEKNIKDQARILTEERNKKITDLLVGQKVTASVAEPTPATSCWPRAAQDHRRGCSRR